MPRVSLEFCDIDVPDEWGEVEIRETYDGPIIAGPKRAGWLLVQVTLGEPHGLSMGPMTDEQLLDLVKTFGETRFWETPSDIISESGPPQVAACSFVTDDGAFVRVWNVLSDMDFVCFFYRCTSQSPGDDLALCERIVRSITFHSAI